MRVTTGGAEGTASGGLSMANGSGLDGKLDTYKL